MTDWMTRGAGSFHTPGCLAPEETSHCAIHHVDEPITDLTYIVCFECGHSWTAKALVRAWRHGVLDITGSWPEPWYKRPAIWLRRRWRWLTIKPDNIFFCPECIHDF